MNEVSIVWKFLIDLFNSDKLVNTVSIVTTLDMDFNKENIYPLVNVDLTESNVEDDAIELSYKITIVQQVDVVPRTTDNKLLTDVNIIDCLNETHAIGQRMINVLSKQNNLENIEISNITSLRRYRGGMSGVEGWQFEIQLFTPNLGSSCYDFTPPPPPPPPPGLTFGNTTTTFGDTVITFND